jgi:hypothetical protein
MSSPEKEKLNPGIFVLEFVVGGGSPAMSLLKFIWQNF